MARRLYTPDQVLAKLRDADVMLAAGLPLAEVAKKLEGSEQTLHRWRNQYGGAREDPRRREGGDRIGSSIETEHPSGVPRKEALAHLLVEIEPV